MLATMLTVLATEGGIPAESPWAKVAVPLGVAIFIGLTYVLIRSNLGTRRGYLVTATSLFGFMVIYSLFWAFGAPGTPPNTGPQNLPGQELDAYQPVFRPFAPDSQIAQDPDYAVVANYPDGFSEDRPATLPEEEVQVAVDEIKTFFSTESDFLPDPPLNETDVAVSRGTDDSGQPIPDVMFAVAENGRPIVAVQYVPTYQLPSGAPAPAEGEDPLLTPGGEPFTRGGEAVPEGEEATADNLAPAGTELGAPVDDSDFPAQTFFAYFDAGNPYFPSLLTVGLMTLLFLIHALLLVRDERLERRQAEEEKETAERVPAGV